MAMLLVAFLIGLPLYDIDVLIYPSHFESYLESYVEFLIDPFGENCFKTRIEIAGGSWKSGYRIEEFDGDYWQFKKDVFNTGSGSVIIDPEPLKETTSATGEAAKGQLRTRCTIEEYELLIRDLHSGKIYSLNDFLGFKRISDRDYMLKHLTRRTYQLLVNLEGSWKAYLFVFERFGNRVSSLWIYLPDKMYEEVKSWPE